MTAVAGSLSEGKGGRLLASVAMVTAGGGKGDERRRPTGGELGTCVLTALEAIG